MDALIEALNVLDYLHPFVAAVVVQDKMMAKKPKLSIPK
jgi:hypothetical protein